MSRFLTPEQRSIRDVARQYATQDVEPLATQMDTDDELPDSLVSKAAELGFFGLMIPEQYGGLGAGMTAACAVLEEIAKASPALAGLFAVQITNCPPMLVSAGTETQKQKYLTATARGEGLMALASTEPAGTANFAAHQTHLVPDGDGYRLNGLKVFCTQGTATTYIVGAGVQQGDKAGRAMVLVERGAPGLEIGAFESKLGWRGSNTGTLIFTNVPVPAENIIGGLLTGSEDTSFGGLTGNIGHSASSLGCVEGLFAKTVDYVKGRNLYGQPMQYLQPVSYWLSDAWVRIEACRSQLYTAARMIDEGVLDFAMVGATKVFVCETAVEVSSRLLQLWGGNGMMNPVGVNRYLRDARVNTVAEGSSEILLSAISSMQVFA